MYGVDEYELTDFEEHQAFTYSTADDWHRAWHRDNGVPIGQPGCPEDACDGDDNPQVWCQTIDSPNFCDGRTELVEPPF